MLYITSSTRHHANKYTFASILTNLKNHISYEKKRNYINVCITILEGAWDSIVLYKLLPRLK